MGIGNFSHINDEIFKKFLARYGGGGGGGKPTSSILMNRTVVKNDVITLNDDISNYNYIIVQQFKKQNDYYFYDISITVPSSVFADYTDKRVLELDGYSTSDFYCVTRLNVVTDNSIKIDDIFLKGYPESGLIIIGVN